MKKAYLKPCMEVMTKEPAQMLCYSTVINPGKPNKPAGVRDSGGWDDEEDNPSEAMSRRHTVWDEDEDEEE